MQAVIAAHRMNVNIQNAQNVHSADTINTTIHYHGRNDDNTGRISNEALTSMNNRERSQGDPGIEEGLPETGHSSGNHLNSSPPSVDGNSRHPSTPIENSQGPRFSTPVQASGDTSAPPSFHSEEEPAPVSVEMSNDYNSVGNRPIDLQADAVMAEPAVAMEELKLPPSAMSLQSDDNVTESATERSSSRKPSSDQDETLQKSSAQPLQAAAPVKKNTAGNRDSLTSGGSQVDIDSGIGDSLRPSVTNSGDTLREATSTEGDGACLTSHSFPSLSSLDVPTLGCDGGGEDGVSSTSEVRGHSSQLLSQSATKDVIVSLKGNQLLVDDDPGILVVDLRFDEQLLKDSQQSHSFPEGASKLLTVKWFGFRQLQQTKWTLKLNADIEASQKAELIHQFSGMMLEHSSETVRRVMKQLVHDHKVYLQHLTWREGLVVCLGHANNTHCNACMQAPQKETIENLLLQLLPDQATGKFAPTDVTLYQGDEEEDEMTLARLSMEVSGGTFRSASVQSVDLFGSLHTSSSTSANSATFRESVSLGNIPSVVSQCPQSPSVDVIESSSQSSIQVISPENSNGNGTLLGMLYSQNEERFQALQTQLTAQNESHRQEMEELKKMLLEKLDRIASNSRTNSKQAESTVQLRKEMDDLSRGVQGMQVKLEQFVSSYSSNFAGLKQTESTLQLQQKSLEALQKDLPAQLEKVGARFDEQKLAMENVQQEMQRQEQRMEKIQRDKDTRFHLAQEDMKRMYATYEMRGRQFLDGAVRQVQETGLQWRELAAQRDKHTLMTLRKFETELALTQMKLEQLQGHVLQQQVRQEDFMQLHQEVQQMKGFQGAGVQQTYTVGLVRGEGPPPEELGAVGGLSAERSFNTALSEAEATTTKDSKQEAMLSNQSESLRLPTFILPSPGVSDGPQLDSLTMPKTYADAAAGSPSSSGHESPEGQNGARRKQTRTDTDRRKNDRRSSPGSDTGAEDDGSGEGTAQSPTKNGKDTGSADTSAGDLAKAEQFLDWISIRSSLGGQSDLAKRLTESVSYALRDEPEPAPRAKCLDTILCLDVSESVVKDGYLDRVKQTALRFVDGIEDLMDEMDLEENIAVIAMGGRARVAQHLTNDLTLVRDAIEKLDDSGGRSPFMEALLVCLAANKGRGGVVNVSGVYKVRPRIIFITDGRPTDETTETGSDVQSNMNQVKFSLVQVMSELSSKKHKSTPRPIFWIPIGNDPDKKFMESLANLGGGKLVEEKDITQLCRYYKLQQTIGRVYKMVKNHKEDYSGDERMMELVSAISVNMTKEEQEEVVKKVREVQKEPSQEEEPDADDFNYVYEDEEKVKNGVLPPLGTRVRRGPHWRWKNQDTDGPGTVINHSKNDNWIYVKWDNGTYNAYRYNEDGRFDLKITPHDPRLLPPDRDSLDFGVRVVRGPDWKSENQDGDGQGTVIRVRESDGRVKVRWEATGKVHEYNYSEAKGREVQFFMPEFPRMEHQVQGDVDKDKDETVDPESEKTIPMWKYRDDKKRWRLYDEDVSYKLEKEYKKRKQGSCVIFRAGMSRRVSFKTWQEKSVDNGPACDVEREMVDEERKNDLLAFELSLQLD